MKSFPNCKINLGLRVLRKRTDGYHDLSSIFLPVPLCDELEIEPMAEEGCHFTQSGIAIDCAPELNICFRAYQLLKEHYPQLPGVRMHLVKNIPFGAGLGGGSSDAAFALKMLNQLFSLGLNQGQLCSYAASLGADCAFFIPNQPALAQGIGDQLTPLDFNPIEGFSLLLAKPSDSVSTREAYSGITLHPEAAQGPSLVQLVRQPVQQWQATVVNDFEQTVFPLHPAIAELKKLCLSHGALYASMSGSGATVFALFPQHSPVPQSLIQSLGSQVLFCQ